VGVVARASKYGRQPFGRLIVEQGRTITGTATALGFDVGYVVRVHLGRVAPSPDLKAALVDLLGMPAERLFTSTALAAEYHAPVNARGLRKEVRG
jgi:hypothetical protein